MTVSRFPFAVVLAAGVALLQSCAPSQDAPAPASTLDLSHYVAVGDSYTAGFSNGGLTRNSQQYAYPNLLAQSFQRVAPGATFTQPLFEQGAGTSYLTLVSYAGSGLPVLRRVPGSGVGTPYTTPTSCGLVDTVAQLTRSTTAGTLPQNLGLPGLRLSQINASGLGNQANAVPGQSFNPYFERLLPANENTTYLQAVTTAASSATFFTFFQGFDEFLPYLRSGGTCLNLLPNSTNLNTNARTILDVLTANNRRGIIVQVPNLNLLPLLSLGKGLELQQRLQQANGNKDTLFILTGDGVSQPIITLPITDADFVLATAIPRIGTPVSVNGVSYPYGHSRLAPIANADVLDQSEFNRINVARTTFNRFLNETLARDRYKMVSIGGKFAFDLGEDLFSQVNSQISINGVPYTTEPVRGNFFSLDYYSLTPRGNALLANALIRAINQAYRSSIPYVSVNDLPTTAN